MWHRWIPPVTALCPGAVAVGVLIDLLGRWIPLEPGRWMLGPASWWWGSGAGAVVLVACFQDAAKRIESPRARRWILGSAWGCLLLAQGICLGWSVGGYGGWMRLGLAFLDAGGGWMGMLVELALTLASAAFFLGKCRNAAPSTEAIPPRLPGPSGGWALWMTMGLGATAYMTFCMAMGLEAWGLRGEVKPRWFEIASWVAMPGMFLPFLGPAGMGAALGWVVFRAGQKLVRLLGRGGATTDRHG